MKNIQMIDGALNCAYSIYEIDDDSFNKLFPRDQQDIEFIEDVFAREGERNGEDLLKKISLKRINKSQANGIHGTLFFGLLQKRQFYPSKQENDLDKRIDFEVIR